MEIVAELSYNHFGDIDRAIRMVDAAKLSGATAVKIEVRDNNSYYRNNPEMIEKRSKYEFNNEQLSIFSDYCNKIGINWFASAHDIRSLFKVLKYEPKYIKVASREAKSLDFIKSIKNEIGDSKPLIISTGGLTFEEIELICSSISLENLILVHAVSIYPCMVDDLNMNRLTKLINQFGCKVGYSGHEEGFIPSLYAAMLGVVYIERHFSIDNQVALGKEKFKDYKCTLNPHTFKEMVNGIRIIDILNRQKVSLTPSKKEIERLNIYGKITWNGNDLYLE